MTVARSSYSRRQRVEQVSEMSWRLALNQARYQNAQERARERAARAEARLARLQPLLVKAGYGPHGAAGWILAEARGVRARREAGRGTAHTGRDCQVCAEGRRMDAARGRVAAYGEIAR
jgi:hypothetical protein